MTISEKKLMEMGIAALLPGFRLMREVIDATENEYRGLLEKLQNGVSATAEPVRRGRPPGASKAILDAVAAALPAPEPAPAAGAAKQKSKDYSASARAGWAKFDTPEKRAAEVIRRQALGKKKKKAKAAKEPVAGASFVVAELAKQIGYANTWGLSAWLRDHNIPQSYEERADAGGRKRRTAVLTQKNYVRMLRLREKLGLQALNQIAASTADKEAVHALEGATRAA